MACANRIAVSCSRFFDHQGRASEHLLGLNRRNFEEPAQTIRRLHNGLPFSSSPVKTTLNELDTRSLNTETLNTENRR